ncbi:histidinol dehydrogenase [Candidatus Ruminimicrobiellum ovillum]|uniref:histidinol dehydrogenase n=1 Tax=Candidatus Ruminimicrobiellum ovillum TaxID=1947927 RepID=UPI00355A6DDB
MNTDIINAVTDIISNIQTKGDSAVIGYLKKFDGVSFKSAKDLRVTDKQINEAVKKVSPALKKAIKASYANVLAFHKKEYSNIKKQWLITDSVKSVGQIYRPIEAVGIYVPGGRFSYPSSVIMNFVAAKVAGVKRIVMMTPPKKMSNEVLFAAKICGIKEIYTIGGAVAIAVLAYGTKTIKPVNMIVGPGNAYVNEAKRLVFGKVGIDSLAGPSEVAIIADSGADKDYVLYDLLAQAEHDTMAKAYLLCSSKEIISYIKKNFDKEKLNQIKIYNVDTKKAIDMVNDIAPEHLELLIKNAKQAVTKIYNAGAIFVGYNTATAVGDYWAGPSHVLPTNASAKYSSGLSVMTFMKRSSYIELKKVTSSVKKQIADFAAAEGLVNHKKSVEVRKI